MSGAFFNSLENIVCDRDFFFKEVVLFSSKFNDAIVMVIK